MITQFKIYEGINSQYEPLQMYMWDLCYIGYDKQEKDYPYIFFQFNSYTFTNWNKFGIRTSNKSNMELKEYIIINNIVSETLNAMENPKFSSGGSNYGVELITNILQKLKKDKEIKIAIETEKYNL